MSNEQKKNASQNRRPRQSSTQKNKDGSDKKRSYKQQVEGKLHPVAEDKDLASNILKNTNMDIDLDEINLLLRSVDKQQPTAPEQDSVPEPVSESAAAQEAAPDEENVSVSPEQPSNGTGGAAGGAGVCYAGKTAGRVPVCTRCRGSGPHAFEGCPRPETEGVEVLL